MNDANGNPIEIAAVVVWRVVDTAQALFEVDDCIFFVGVQAETALRALAGTHPYDAPSGQIALLGNQDIVAASLAQQLQDQLHVVGIAVVETRLAYLAYAPGLPKRCSAGNRRKRLWRHGRASIVDGVLGNGSYGIGKFDDETSHR